MQRKLPPACENVQTDADYSREVLVLYLERPERDSGQLHGPGGALLIQRLEGSRPHGRLCTLNRSEQVQRDQAPAELGGMCRFDGGMVRWNTGTKCQSGAPEICSRAISDR
jgi:hypothetical protein